MGCACSEPFDLADLYAEVTTAGPYRGLTYEAFEEVVDLVATGGYALRTMTVSPASCGPATAGGRSATPRWPSATG